VRLSHEALSFRVRFLGVSSEGRVLDSKCVRPAVTLRVGGVDRYRVLREDPRRAELWIKTIQAVLLIFFCAISELFESEGLISKYDQLIEHEYCLLFLFTVIKFFLKVRE